MFISLFFAHVGLKVGLLELKFEFYQIKSGQSHR